NQNLEELIRQGRFREDLYFRLDVVRIEVPPLRERGDDIPLLVAHFLQQTGAEGVSDGAAEILRGYAWPGNVRELRSAIERGAVLSRGRLITREHLPETVLSPRMPSDLDARIGGIVAEVLRAPDGKEGDLLRRTGNRWERALIARVLEKTGWNQVQASRILGINRLTLRKRIRKYGLEKK
ncbi:MAG: AAA-type ATPase lid domain-containing protein, partial [Planctomycetota bacterium]